MQDTLDAPVAEVAPTAGAAKIRMCVQPRPRPIALPDNVAPPRASAIRLNKKKWANGTVIHFCFVDEPEGEWPEAQKAIARRAFAAWQALGIGLVFSEVATPSEAEVRISFYLDGRSWSLVGVDVLDETYNGPTMHFGWDLSDDWGHATALHEIGHTLGLSHEHQNPHAGIVWDERRVIEAYSGDPNYWNEADIRHNILEKLALDEVNGSNWDPTSVMHYPIDAGLIRRPREWRERPTPRNTALSEQDIAWVKRFYPPMSAVTPPIGVLDLKPLPTRSGAQADFLFQPTGTRDYSVQTVGTSDSKIVIFVERDGEPRHFASTDDSGTPDNARIVAKFVRGERYTIRVRTHFAEPSVGLGLLIV